jgi:DNA-binding cell septation regulator SpoVG
MSEDLVLKITKVDLELKPEGPAHTLATGTVTYNSGLKVRIRVMDSQKGPFAKLPNFRIGEGNDAKFFDYVFFTGDNPKALRDDLNAKVIAEYNHIVTQYAEGEGVTSTDATDAEDDSPFEADAE